MSTPTDPSSQPPSPDPSERLREQSGSTLQATLQQAMQHASWGSLNVAGVTSGRREEIRGHVNQTTDQVTAAYYLERPANYQELEQRVMGTWDQNVLETPSTPSTYYGTIPAIDSVGFFRHWREFLRTHPFRRSYKLIVSRRTFNDLCNSPGSIGGMYYPSGASNLRPFLRIENGEVSLDPHCPNQLAHICGENEARPTRLLTAMDQLATAISDLRQAQRSLSPTSEAISNHMQLVAHAEHLILQNGGNMPEIREASNLGEQRARRLSTWVEERLGFRPLPIPPLPPLPPPGIYSPTQPRTRTRRRSPEARADVEARLQNVREQMKLVMLDKPTQWVELAKTEKKLFSKLTAAKNRAFKREGSVRGEPRASGGLAGRIRIISRDRLQELYDGVPEEPVEWV